VSIRFHNEKSKISASGGSLPDWQAGAFGGSEASAAHLWIAF